MGLIVQVWKIKGNLHDKRIYGGITLPNHMLKLLERILDGRIRAIMEREIGEEQPGFRKGTTDGMFALRQLV